MLYIQIISHETFPSFLIYTAKISYLNTLRCTSGDIHDEMALVTSAIVLLVKAVWFPREVGGVSFMHLNWPRRGVSIRWWRGRVPWSSETLDAGAGCFGQKQFRHIVPKHPFLQSLKCRNILCRNIRDGFVLLACYLRCLSFHCE